MQHPKAALGTLLYAGDVFSGSSKQELQDYVRIWKGRPQKYGFKLIVKITEHIEVGLQTNSSLNVDELLRKGTSFRCLKSRHHERGAQRDVNGPNNPECSKWRKFTGIISNSGTVEI